MRVLTLTLLLAATWALVGCSNEPVKETVRTVPAGDKAAVGHLTYNVVDQQILTQLGDETSPRVPHDRFILIQVAVSNSSNVDNPIPAIELVSDSGQTFNEQTDGTGVTNWFGLARHVGSGQTERGVVVFDAPAAHYKIRFTDEAMDKEVMADLPLSYAHEKDNEALIPTTELPTVMAPTGSQKQNSKPK